jgi:hypothetical protein
MEAWSSASVAPGFFKFYYFPRSAEGTQGWWQREFEGAVWAVITAQGNIPPIIETLSELANTTLSDPRDVSRRCSTAMRRIPLIRRLRE